LPEKEIFTKKEIKEIDIKKKKVLLIMVELNSADSIALISVSGIGPFYAKQIIKYRNDLGGFISLKQFPEIWGLEKIDLERVSSQITIENSNLRKINLNTSTIEGLWNHPYLNYKQSKSIVNYRMQHGDYNLIEDIQDIVLIDSILFRKIAPYLKTHD
tara:strand:+ start:160 stop:633 length:474 start_codon:yes stop_codon:yes gene_type:complete